MNKLPFSTFMERYLRNSAGAWFFHENFSKKTSEPESVYGPLDVELRKKTGHPIQIRSREFRRGKKFMAITPDRLAWKEYQDRMEQVVESLFRSAGFSSRIPTIECICLREDTVLESPTPERVPLYFVGDTKEGLHAHYEIIDHTGPRSADFSEGNSQEAGAIDIDFRIQGDRLVMTTKPVLISWNNGTVQAYVSGPCETLHAALGPERIIAVKRSLDGGNPLQRSADAAILEEEGFIHAALHMWLQSKEEKEGLHPHDVNKQIRIQQAGPYRRVPDWAKFMEKNGMEEAHRQYRSHQKLEQP
tara:strand:+ start:357 stop:1265 length:909 start_codon:yes stop_codon:yes gene_type:complete